jgi:hypothetical protein
LSDVVGVELQFRLLVDVLESFEFTDPDLRFYEHSFCLQVTLHTT